MGQAGQVHAQHAAARQARHAAAELALLVGDLRLAQAAAEAAVGADPFDEPATRMLMRVHVAAGAPGWALIVYERLRTTLATELGVDPADVTRDLHVTVLRGALPITRLRAYRVATTRLHYPGATPGGMAARMDN